MRKQTRRTHTFSLVWRTQHRVVVVESPGVRVAAVITKIGSVRVAVRLTKKGSSFVTLSITKKG